MTPRIPETAHLTIDLWDTVLRRTCHPEALKRYAAGVLVEQLGLHGVSVAQAYEQRLAIEQQHAASNKAGEFTLQAVVLDWVAHYAPAMPIAQQQQCASALIAAEQDKEASVTYADPETVAALQAFPVTPYYLSDYYCGRSHLDRILQQTGVAPLVAGGLVSCEENASKREGGLFDIARQKLGLTGPWVHLGDNPHSDVAQARKHRVRGIGWTTAETAQLPAKNAAYQARLRGELAWGLPAPDSAEAPSVFGARLAPLVAGYCAHVAAVAERTGAAKILFLAREGIFLGNAFSRVSPLPHVTLDVSRRATYAASLGQGHLSEFKGMWQQYHSQSPAAFCMTLNAPETVFRDLFEAHGLPWDAPIPGIASSPAVALLFKNPAFSAALAQHIASERQALCGYLETMLGELPQPGKTYLVADVGWKGTIQDNFARLFPASTWVGVYCGLAPLPPQAPNSQKEGYITDAAVNADWPRYLVQTLPFELLFNAKQGSTLGYERTAAGVWAPCYDELAGESLVHEQFTSAVQLSCLEALPQLLTQLDRQAVSWAEVREVARALWLAVQEAPPKCLVRAAFQLEHNESFGVGDSVTFRRDLRWADLVQSLTDTDHRSCIRGWLAQMPWRKVILWQQETSWATKVALILYGLRQKLR